MKNEEKAAVIMLSLDENTATEVMKNLRPVEIKRLGKLMSRITQITPDTLLVVAKDFYKLAEELSGTISVTNQYARKIVRKALGETEGAQTADGYQMENVYDDNPIVDKLRDIDTKFLMEFTKTEHPQTIALILAHLRPEQAAEMMESYAPALQSEIARRIATLKTVPQEFIEEVARTLENEILVRSSSDKEIGGARVVAEILSILPRVKEQEILAMIDESDTNMAIQIRNLMFNFDDVLKLDDKAFQELLREVSTDDLSRALKLVEEGLRDKIYRNMSKRAADMLREEIELMPPVRLSEVETSQKTIVDLARKLEVEGRIVISRGGGAGDEYV